VSSSLKELSKTDPLLSQVTGGYYNPFPAPDPTFTLVPLPLGDVNPPKPQPYWGFGYIDPSWGIPTPEPALPIIGKP